MDVLSDAASWRTLTTQLCSMKIQYIILWYFTWCGVWLQPLFILTFHFFFLLTFFDQRQWSFIEFGKTQPTAASNTKRTSFFFSCESNEKNVAQFCRRKPCHFPFHSSRNHNFIYKISEQRQKKKYIKNTRRKNDNMNVDIYRLQSYCVGDMELLSTVASSVCTRPSQLTYVLLYFSSKATPFLPSKSHTHTHRTHTRIK